MREWDVQEYEFELSVGDVLQIGESRFTVIDIDDLEVSLRVDSGDTRIETGLQQMCVPR